MMNDPFYQIVSIDIGLDRQYSAGEINRILKELGATLHYDVYGFERLKKGPIWQSESYVYVVLFCNNEEVDAQNAIDKIELQYPLATIGTEYISKFVDVAIKLGERFNSRTLLNGTPVDKNKLTSYCDGLVSDLMKEWGEEPGSETLRMLIEQDYPK